MVVKPKFLIPLVDKQFEILGLQIRCKSIPEDGIITVGKKKDYWYNIYRFTEEEDKEWTEWCKSELAKINNGMKWYQHLSLVYGLPLSYKKEREP